MAAFQFAWLLLALVVAWTLFESRKDTAIGTPRTEVILLALALLGDLIVVAVLVSLDLEEAAGNLLLALFAWTLLLLLGVPLAFGRRRLLLLARQLEHHGETTEPRDISTYRSGKSHYVTYRYGDNCRGRARKPVGTFEVLYLPSRPQLHRPIPVGPETRRRRSNSQVQVLAQRRITISHAAFAQVIQDILDAPYQQYVLCGLDTTSDFLLQLSYNRKLWIAKMKKAAYP